MPELEQAVVGGTERHWDSRGQLDVESFRHWPCVSRRHRAQGRVRAYSINGGDLLTDLKVRDFRPYLDYLAAGLVANHVRLAEQCSMPTIERVAAFDTYYLDANHDAFRMTLRIRNVLVLENFRTSVLIVNRSLHHTLLTRR